MRVLKCGHISISDTDPICPICAIEVWRDDPVPAEWADPDMFPKGKFTCAVCDGVSDTYFAMPEYHTDGEHIHYCGCRSRPINPYNLKWSYRRDKVITR